MVLAAFLRGAGIVASCVALVACVAVAGKDFSDEDCGADCSGQIASRKSSSLDASVSTNTTETPAAEPSLAENVVPPPSYRLPFPCGTRIIASVSLQKSCDGSPWHSDSDHFAIDFSSPDGLVRGVTPVLSARTGRVSIVKSDIGPGDVCFNGYSGGCTNCNQANYVFVDHDDGTRALYLHLQTVSVKVGDSVAQGGKLGTVGVTGCSNGPHVHFSVSPTNHGWYPLQTFAAPFEEANNAIPPPESCGSPMHSKNGC